MDTQDRQDHHEQAAASDTNNVTSYAGIDVSKMTLDVAVRPSTEAWQTANDEAGIAAFVARLQSLVSHTDSVEVIVH